MVNSCGVISMRKGQSEVLPSEMPHNIAIHLSRHRMRPGNYYVTLRPGDGER